MAHQVFKSDKTNITSTIEMEVSPNLSHCFAGIRYFDSDDNPVTPTAGKVTIEAKFLTNQRYATAFNGVINFDEPAKEAEWGGNVVSVKTTPSNLAGPGLATYQIVVAQNIS